MKITRHLAALGSVAALALAVPTASFGHGTVFQTTVNGTPSVPANSTDLANYPDQIRYIASNHGYPYAYDETNGATTDGMLNFAKMPGAWRTAKYPLPAETDPGYAAALLAKRKGILNEPEGQSGVQVHASCSYTGITDEDVLAWQGSDPFYNYLVWQNEVAYPDESVATFVSGVKTATSDVPGAPAGGVDLSTLTTAALAKTACEALPGGVYLPADTKRAVVYQGVIDDTKKPLDAQIATLTAEKTTLTNDRNTLQAALAAMTTAKQAVDAALAAAQKTIDDMTRAAVRPLKVTPSGRRIESGDAHLVTGRAGSTVLVRITVTPALQRALKLRSNVIASERVKLDRYGASIASPELSAAAADALEGRRGGTPVRIVASSGRTNVGIIAILIGL